MAKIPQKFAGLLGKFAESLNYDDLPKGWADNPEIVSAAEELYQKMGTKSPFFRAWFGNSKAVDEAGNPLKVYHGTNVYDLKKFRPGQYGYLGGGIYTTPNRNIAEKYTNYNTVHDLYEKMENPFVVENIDPSKEIFEEIYGSSIKAENEINKRMAKQSNFSRLVNKNDAKKIASKGYDGIFWNTPAGVEYSTLDPTALKSTSNRGTFNPDDPNIYRSALPLAVGGAGAAALGMSPDEAEAAAVPGFSQMYDRAVRDGSKKVMYAGTLDNGVYQQAARRDPTVLNNQVFIGPHAGNARYGTGEMTPLEVGQHVENLLNSADTKVLPGFPSANYRNNAGNMLFLNDGTPVVAPYMGGSGGDIVLKTVFKPDHAKRSFIEGYLGRPLSPISGLRSNPPASAQQPGLSAVRQPSDASMAQSASRGNTKIPSIAGAATGAALGSMPVEAPLEEPMWSPVDMLVAPVGVAGAGAKAAAMAADPLIAYGMDKVAQGAGWLWDKGKGTTGYRPGFGGVMGLPYGGMLGMLGGQ